MNAKINEAEARRLYDEGKRDVEIAEVFGVTAGAIWHWRKSRGLKAVKKEDTPMALKVPSIDALPAEVKEKVKAAMAQQAAPDSQQLSPADPEVNKVVYLHGGYDPLIYDAIEQAVEYAREDNIQVSLVWRRLQASVEAHMAVLKLYLMSSTDACYYTVHLAARAAVDEIKSEISKESNLCTI